MKAAIPYVEYDKVGLRQLLSYASKAGSDEFAPATRTCIEEKSASKQSQEVQRQEEP